MSNALILHDIKDAEHCVKNSLFVDSLLFSSHPSVCVYLKEKHGLDCQCLSKFFKIDEIKKYKIDVMNRVDEILNEMDKNMFVLDAWNRDVRINYFTVVYPYLAKNHYFGCLFFIEGVRRVIQLYKLKNIKFYNYTLNTFLDAASDIESLVCLSLSNIDCEFVHHSAGCAVSRDRLNKSAAKLLRFIDDPLLLLRKKVREHLNSRWGSELSAKKKTILLFRPLKHLEYLKEDIKRYNVLDFSDCDYENSYSVSKENLDLKLNSCSIKSPIDKIFINDLKNDFSLNINKWTAALKALEDINRKYPIVAGIWDIPPYHKVRSVVFEYLRIKNIKIIGVQHGCFYGTCFDPWHFSTDYDKCDYYVTFGFTRDDFARLYPARNPRCEMLPFGPVSLPAAKDGKTKKTIDILFPITNSMSIFSGGMTRVPPDILAERQTILLEYLNSLTGTTVYVKPFYGSTYESLAALPVLERLKNIKVVSHLSLAEFLKHYMPRAVLIEYPSQPLFDVLHLDTEIFLMDDSIRPYEAGALEELKKRVYYSENLNEIMLMMKMFLRGELPPKRDNTFYEHYAYKKGAQENLMALIDKIAGDKP